MEIIKGIETAYRKKKLHSIFKKENKQDDKWQLVDISIHEHQLQSKTVFESWSKVQQDQSYVLHICTDENKEQKGEMRKEKYLIWRMNC